MSLTGLKIVLWSFSLLVEADVLLPEILILVFISSVSNALFVTYFRMG